MSTTSKILLSILGLGVVGVGFYFGRRAYIKSRTTSGNPQKDERNIKQVVNP
jgi:hypothetical protein